MALIDRHAKILEDRGLDVELLERLGVESSTRLGSETIAIPYFVDGAQVNTKYRTIGGDKKFSQEVGAKKAFWNVDVIADPSLASQPLIITEGEFDAMAALQAGFGRVVSVPDGAPSTEIADRDALKYAFIETAPAALRDCHEIILAVDSDAVGVNLLNDLSLRLGVTRCKWVKYPKGCKDLNDALKAFGIRGVTESINRAQWMAVDGVYRMSELPPLPARVPHDTGIDGLGDHYRIRAGDFCVVTGIPSHGKTSAVNDIVCRMNSKYGWPAAWASFEQSPQADHRRALRTWFNRKLVISQTDREIAAADAWIDDNFVFIVPDPDDSVTLEWTLERCSAAVVRFGAKIVIIDPWNEMDHDRPKDMSLTEYVGFAIKQFKKFAQKHSIHLIVVAHPAKMKRNEDGSYSIPSLYDISDSAHWYNKPDVGLVIHRKDEQKTIFRIAKSRYHTEIGTPGDVELRYWADRASYVAYEHTA